MRFSLQCIESCNFSDYHVSPGKKTALNVTGRTFLRLHLLYRFRLRDVTPACVLWPLKSGTEKSTVCAKPYKCSIFICQEPVASGLVVMWDLPASPPPISTMQAAPMHICLYTVDSICCTLHHFKIGIYSHANLIVTWDFIRSNWCR